MTKGERAIEALREAADALEALPHGIRSVSIFGGAPIIDPERLRNEATAIERRMEAWKEAATG
jgi:hypothetical protein